MDGNTDLLIRVDEVQASKLGLTFQEVERQLRAIYQGQIATQVRESAARITDVRVRYPDRFRFGPGRFSPDQLLTPLILLPTPLPASTGGSVSLDGLARAVPVEAVAKIERKRTPDEQVRENLQPAVIITADVNEAEAGLGAVVQDVR